MQARSCHRLQDRARRLEGKAKPRATDGDGGLHRSSATRYGRASGINREVDKVKATLLEKAEHRLDRATPVAIFDYWR